MASLWRGKIFLSLSTCILVFLLIPEGGAHPSVLLLVSVFLLILEGGAHLSLLLLEK